MRGSACRPGWCGASTARSAAFLRARAELIAGRVRARAIVDGHGDLRPEHIWLDDHVTIIDCLEFNAGLRAVDPFDEIAYLCVECDRLGGAWASAHIRRRAIHALRDHLSDELFTFYRCHRASLRARLDHRASAGAHPRTPEKWPRRAREYLAVAAADARAAGTAAQNTSRSVSARPCVQAADGFRQQRRHRQDVELRRARRHRAGTAARCR